MTDANKPTEGMNTGHGHVFKRPDGVRMRCGGPRMCAECAKDLARKERATNPVNTDDLQWIMSREPADSALYRMANELLRLRSSGGARVERSNEPHDDMEHDEANCPSCQRDIAASIAPEPRGEWQVALDRACYVLMEMMQAYERRIRSDCIIQAQIDNKPWECAEYIKAERFLKAIWKDGKAQPFAALDEFLGYLRSPETKEP